MKYYKLKISLENYENDLNRVILFNSKSDLDHLAYTILSIFNTLAYHLFMFLDGDDQYECELSLNEALEMGYPDVGEQSYGVKIDQLKAKDSKFLMVYDFGEDYTFVIEILETLELEEYFKIPLVIDGHGYGIIEDDKDTLERFLDGKPLEFPPLFIKHNRFNLVDFNEFDLEECNKKLKREFSKIRNGYLGFY